MFIVCSSLAELEPFSSLVWRGSSLLGMRPQDTTGVWGALWAETENESNWGRKKMFCLKGSRENVKCSYKPVRSASPQVVSFVSYSGAFFHVGICNGTSKILEIHGCKVVIPFEDQTRVCPGSCWWGSCLEPVTIARDDTTSEKRSYGSIKRNSPICSDFAWWFLWIRTTGRENLRVEVIGQQSRTEMLGRKLGKLLSQCWERLTAWGAPGRPSPRSSAQVSGGQHSVSEHSFLSHCPSLHLDA